MFLAVQAATACMLALGLNVHAQQSITATAAENSNLWFIELADKPLADGNSKQKLNAAKQAFRKAAAEAGVNYTERRSFDTLFNGF